MFKKIVSIGLTSILLSILPISQVAAGGCCPGVDLTGCCPPPPAQQFTSCTIFGCHTCSGRGCNESCANGCQQSCIPLAFQPCCKPKVKCRIPKKIVKKVIAVKPKIVVPVAELPCCKEPRVCATPCAPLPCIIVKCKVIFPGDIQETMCHEFKQKLRTCEVDSCYSAYVQDPTLKTTWKIIGKKGNRCVISSTSENVGLIDDDRNPIPMTQTCEYDQIGINALIKRFNDMVQGYYHFTTCERGVGIHNCSITTDGKPIQKARRDWY